MNSLATTTLTAVQRHALQILRTRLFSEFDVEKIILYGSVARGEGTAESDVDLLIVTRNKKSRWQQHEITDIVFEVNLQFDTTFSSLVVDRNEWESSHAFLLLQNEIEKDGIEV